MVVLSRTRHVAGAQRRHARRQPFDRRELERRGWRTTLDYRENHERDAAGVLGAVVAEWSAEGERIGADGEAIAVVAVGPSPAAAWRRLRAAAESAGSSMLSVDAARR